MNTPRSQELRAMLLPAAAVVSPRYRAGEAIIIDLAAIPAPSDEVLLVLHDGRMLVRELTAINAEDCKLLAMDGSSMALPLSEVRQAVLVVGTVRRRAVATGAVAGGAQ